MQLLPNIIDVIDYIKHVITPHKSASIGCQEQATKVPEHLRNTLAQIVNFHPMQLLPNSIYGIDYMQHVITPHSICKHPTYLYK